MNASYREPLIIATEADLDFGVAALMALEPRFAPVRERVGQPPLRRMPPDLQGLLGLIFHQQVSLASGRAIEARFRDRFGSPEPQRLAAATEAELAACGLSRPKIRTVKAIAAAISGGSLDLSALETLGDAEVRVALQRVHGVGPWTAELWLLSALGRPDAWPAGDLALQAAVADVLGLVSRPAAREMAALAEAWRPWRAVAARLLWSHYVMVKSSR
jgi:DNA-3-methyladenine glycosylase II